MKVTNIVYLIGILQLVVVDPIMWYITQEYPFKYESLWAVVLVINLFMFAAIIFLMLQRTIKVRV